MSSGYESRKIGKKDIEKSIALYYNVFTGCEIRQNTRVACGTAKVSFSTFSNTFSKTVVILRE